MFANEWILTEDPNEPNSAGVGAVNFIIAASDSPARMKAKADYVCDGIADNVEIQAAIDALPSEGGTVVLSTGTFNLPHTIWPCDNLYLRGQGMFSTVLHATRVKPDDTPIISRNHSPSTRADLRTSSDNPSHGIHFSDFKIDGTDAWGKGTSMKYMQDAIFERVFVYKVGYSGFGNDWHRNVVYRNCRAEDCGWARVKYPNGEYMSCSGFGLGIGAWSDEFCIVTNCIARNNVHDGFCWEIVSGSGKICQHYVFKNCLSEGNQYGFEIDSKSNSATPNMECAQVSLDNCWAYDNDRDGIWVEGTNAEVTVSNNFISGNGQRGIFASEHRRRNLLLAHNQVVGNSEQGILVRSGNVSLLGNYAFGNELDGIALIADESDIDDVLVANNTCWNNSVNGHSSSGISIEGSANYGLSRISLTGNKSYDSSGTALSISSASRNFGPLCTITLTLPHLYVTGDSVTVAGVNQSDFNGTFTVTVTSAKTFTYYKSGTAGDSSGGTATRQPSQEYGISIVGSGQGFSDSLVTGNFLEHNKTGALYLDNSNGSNNLITNNKGYVTMNSGTVTGTGLEQTIPHGLSATPTIVLLSNVDEGANPYQSSPVDVNNIHITASDGKKYQWVTMVR